MFILFQVTFFLSTVAVVFFFTVFVLVNNNNPGLKWVNASQDVFIIENGTVMRSLALFLFQGALLFLLYFIQLFYFYKMSRYSSHCKKCKGWINTLD